MRGVQRASWCRVWHLPGLSIVFLVVLLGCGGGGDGAGRGQASSDSADLPPVATTDWPSFRGVRASGIAQGDGLPVAWDAEQDRNVEWRTAIPGLGHSSPVVWGDRVFVTTAVRTGGEGHGGISLLVIERDRAGFSVSKKLR